MDRKSIQNAVVQCSNKLNDESRLCFGAATGCFVVGVAGWLVNLAIPGTTLLHGLLVVAGFYCLLGVLHVFKRLPIEVAQPDDLTNDVLNDQPVEKKQFQSAA